MNSAASVRARLLNLSKQIGEDFQALLNRYAIERFLYRLGASDQSDEFILKGAMLFVVWQGNLHRPTRDLDLLGFGDPSPGAVAERIRAVVSLPADDGILFDPSSIDAAVIREDTEYEGVRVKLSASLEQARIRLQVDIGFGDVVDPAPARTVKGGVKRNHRGGAKGDHFKPVRELGYWRFGAGWSGALRGRRPSV
jgi:hypothetical protein